MKIIDSSSIRYLLCSNDDGN